MKVVIDTNVLLVCISPKAKTNIILQAIESGTLHLCVTVDIMLEYEEIFESHSGFLGKSLLKEILSYMPNLISVNTYFNWGLILEDPDDNKFVDCAIATNADYIITEDKHFDVLKTIGFPSVKVINTTDFINQYLKEN